MKSCRERLPRQRSQSRPAWGEWIEIKLTPWERGIINGLAPHGASGLKFTAPGRVCISGVSPRMGRVD